MKVAAILMLTVALSFAEASTTTMKPTTTTMRTTFTTPPMGCMTDSGERLFPGQTMTIGGGGSCQVCTCHSWGMNGLECYYGDCLPPMCIDYFLPQGSCCYKCPNGRNCRIQGTGEVIPADQPVSRNGQICHCPPQDHNRLPGTPMPEDTIAICIQDTTTPPPTTTPLPVG